MLKSLFSLLFFLFFLLSFSQNSIVLKGKVIDETTKLPIESATVYLSSIKDSTVVDYTITDKFGKFNFKIKKIEKPVYLKISYISYEEFKLQLNNVIVDKDFGEILLNPKAKNLDEVVIKSEAPPIRIKKDTLEFNATSFKVRPDANVESLLKQLPGVEVDNEGKVTVNGKEVNQVLVNGKPFFDKDGKVALQNLPSDIVKKVQVSDTKTTKEEKTGQASTSNNASINLTIDEKKNKGFFGKVMAGAGSDKRYESSGLMNYFKDKTKISVLASSNNINSTGFSMDEIFDNMGGGRSQNVSMSSDGSFGVNGRRFGGGSGITRSSLFGINYSDQWAKDLESTASYFFSNTNSENLNRTTQINLLPSGNFETNSTSKTSEERFGHNINFELEYKIDSLTSIVIEPKYSKATGKVKNTSQQSSLDNLNELLNESNSKNFSESDSDNFSNALTFSKSFKKKGRYISVGLNNNNTIATDKNKIQSNTFFYQDSRPDDIRNQLGISKNSTDNYSTEFDYSEPITDSLQVNLGADIRFNNSIRKLNTFDFDSTTDDFTIENDLLTRRTSSSTRTIIPRSGFEWNKSKFRINFDLGTSIIKFDNSSDYLNVIASLSKDYALPFIRTNFNYKMSKAQNIWLNYSYDYSMPSAAQVLPIEDLSNPLNTIIGNENLDINKNHNINFNYSNYDYETRSGYGFYTGGNFYTSQVVSSTTFDNDRKRTTTYVNVSGTSNYWFGFYLNKTIKKELNTFKYGLRIGSNGNESKGFTDGEMFGSKTLSITPRVNLTYEYGELFTINPTYNYTYSKTDFTNYVVNSASNFTHRVNVQVTNFWPTNWVFGNDFGYTYNSNIADGFKKDFYLWNTSLSYSFYQKKLMAKVKVYDMLNQNVSATRTITPTSIRDEENVVLRRYVMFSLTYKLNKFGAKEKKPSNRFNW